MSTPTAAVVSGLRLALQGMADALEGVRLDGFLEHSAALTVALGDARAAGPVAPAERAALLGELAAARAQVQRGLRLGASLNDLIQMTAAPHGWASGYRRDGQPELAACAPAVDERG